MAGSSSEVNHNLDTYSTPGIDGKVKVRFQTTNYIFQFHPNTSLVHGKFGLMLVLFTYIITIISYNAVRESAKKKYFSGPATKRVKGLAT